MKNKGLTLVELLVAISVLGFVAVLGWRGLDGIVRARVALASGLEQTRGMQLAFAQLQSDCAHLVNPSTLPNRVPLDAKQGRLTLVRTVFADNQPSRLQVISYRVNDGVLTRRESAATRDLRELDAQWLAAENDTDTSQAVVLQSDVAALTLRLWLSDGSGWRSDVSAPIPVSSNTPTAASFIASIVIPALPTGLEVTMQLRGHDTGMLKVFMLGAV
jgi:general secretion pathway protein J